jgi:CubicO group peptidase (beta-lactamase class C family)
VLPISLADAVIRTGNVAALSIAVVRAATRSHEGLRHGELEHDVPATEQTVYRIGSGDEAVHNRWPLMRLVEQGKLSLDDD